MKLDNKQFIDKLSSEQGINEMLQVEESQSLKKRFDQLDKKRQQKALLKKLMIAGVLILTVGLGAFFFSEQPHGNIPQNNVDKNEEVSDSTLKKPIPKLNQEEIIQPKKSIPTPNQEEIIQPEKKQIIPPIFEIKPKKSKNKTFAGENLAFKFYLDKRKHLLNYPIIQEAFINQNYAIVKQLIDDELKIKTIDNTELKIFRIIVHLLSTEKINAFQEIGKLEKLEVTTLNNIKLKNNINWTLAYLYYKASTRKNISKSKSKIEELYGTIYNEDAALLKKAISKLGY